MKIWNLAKLFMKFEILNPSENQNLRSLTLDHKIGIFWAKIEQIWWKFWRKSKIWVSLTLKCKNLTKSQNLKSLTLKSKIFIFEKIWQKIKIPPRWFIITLRFHQNSSGHNFEKFVPIWALTDVRQTFFKILKSISKSPKFTQNWLSLPKFCKKNS